MRSNTLLRRLLLSPLWTSESNIFATLNIRSHQDVVTLVSFGLSTQRDVSISELLHTLRYSGASVVSDFKSQWSLILYTS